MTNAINNMMKNRMHINEKKGNKEEKQKQSCIKPQEMKKFFSKKDQ